MRKDQLISIAKAGFPRHIQEMINIDKLEFISMGNVHRLYEKDTPFIFVLPKISIIAICIYDGWVQFDTTYMAFNQYAAIKETKRLGLIKNQNSILNKIKHFLNLKSISE